MSMKKIWLSLAAIASTALLVTGASFALFTATSNTATHTFNSGTVRLDGNGAFPCVPADTVINNIAPGDSGTYGCTVTYVGSLDAWIGLTTSSTGALMSCDGANSLGINISGTVTNPNTTPPTLLHSATYNNNAADQVVFKAIGGAPPEDMKFTLDWALPLASGNGCQGKQAVVSMTVKAVQAKNNTNGSNTGPNAWS